MDPAVTREGDSVASVVDNTQETTAGKREASHIRSSYVPPNSMHNTVRSLDTTLRVRVPVSGNISDLRLMI